MSLLQQAPRFSAAAAAAIARELFGVDGSARPLPSERDQNFALETSGGERFVLKLANAAEARGMLEAQNAAMAHLAGHTAICPRVIPSRDGRLIAEARADDGTAHFARLVTWLPGVALGVTRWQPLSLFEELGARLGEIDRALQSFDHPALHRDFHWDAAGGVRLVREHAPLVTDTALRDVILRAVDRIERDDAGRFERLRRSAIHNDANDHNVLVTRTGDWYTSGPRVTGLIDFGDMVHSFTVAELAVATAYAVLGKRDPMAVAAALVRGYHAEYPLTDDELAVLFGLATLRLCMSVALAADQHGQRPGDEYLLVSQDGIRKSLPEWLAVHPRYAEAALRHACGLTPVPRGARVAAWLENVASPAPLLDVSLDGAAIVDLGVGSALVSGDARENAAPALQRRIEETVRAAGVTCGVGRHGEARVLYASPLFATGSGDRRTVHLGTDLFVPEGSTVRAPLAGTVRALSDNADPQDYGPVVILEHATDEGDVFFTLYGHLGRESLPRLRAGQALQAGETVGTVGSPRVNGGWPPHVHVQVIVDLLERGTDFPGVCRAAERDVWSAFSPDARAMLRISPRRSSASSDLPDPAARRRRVVGANLRLGYRRPVRLARGWMQYLYDDAGRQYLDAYNNVPHVGHCHPRVVAAAEAQMRVLNTNTRYLHDSLAAYAERLVATLPPPLTVCYFVNSGSEANELALRLARAHTGGRDVIVLEGAYHGNTTTLVEISPYKFDGPGGAGRAPWVHVAPMPDVYRGAHRPEDPDAGRKYAAGVADALAAARARGGRVAAYIAETCPSVGGQIVFPPGYLRAAYQHVREAGGICVADEVQTAYGRMGTSFYAFEDQHVVPDIVVLGKPIGNGHPIGAVITTEAIARSFDNGMEFFSTFGGNTVSCAVGTTVLDIVQRERLQAHARRVGDHLLDRLGPLARRHELIGDVRGSGLFIGVELVRDRQTLAPAHEEAAFVVNRMREEGILIGTDGPFQNVLKIRPPMPFTTTDADLLVETLDGVLAELC
ncbi:MAG TPA: aminotransferase class III-fold pyridoxal phosphate-dependent enzyme [Vicinamibacterales bacterium]|nr:aminotransferase class III-fold pyridoxal phosphate-dependent enzyme [Vicinamibacterales bacterium]